MNEGKINHKRILHIPSQVIDNWREPKDKRRLGAVIIITVLLALCGSLVYLSGGTEYSYLHFIYIPILTGAFFFKIPGGCITGIMAGIILGPFMPLDSAHGLQQPTANWVFRTVFFACLGIIAGYLISLLNRRLNTITKMVNTIAETYARTLKTFAFGVALRDEQTGGHCERVAHNSCVLGEAAGLDRISLEHLYWTGILHDLGKIAVPEHILLKPGKLTDAEFEEMKRHTTAGYEMLVSVSQDFTEVAQGVRSHHEYWDGHGYPDSLNAENIPLFGRIVAIVDVFEALTTDRPYRSPMPAEQALAYLKEHAGAHFDPTLVSLFEEQFRKGKIYVSGDTSFALHYHAPLRFSEKVAVTR